MVPSHRLILLLLAPLYLGCGTDNVPEPTEPTEPPRARTLIDNNIWVLLDATQDPFHNAKDPKATECRDVDAKPEVVGDELWYDIETHSCAYATSSQPLQDAMVEGAPINFRIWHYKQTTADSDYRVVLAVGAEPTIIYEATVAAPNDKGGLLFGEFPAPAAFPKGTPVYWHLSNHGDNTWGMIELTITY